MRFKHFMLDCFHENISIPLSNWPPLGRSLTGVFERPTRVAKKFMTRATEWLMDPNGDACAAWPRLVTSLCPPPIVITTITTIIKVIVNIIIIIAAASSDSTSWSAWRQVYVFPSAHDSQGLGARSKTALLKKYPTSDFYEHIVSCCAARPKEKSAE